MNLLKNQKNLFLGFVFLSLVPTLTRAEQVYSGAFQTSVQLGNEGYTVEAYFTPREVTVDGDWDAEGKPLPPRRERTGEVFAFLRFSSGQKQWGQIFLAETEGNQTLWLPIGKQEKGLMVLPNSSSVSVKSSLLRNNGSPYLMLYLDQLQLDSSYGAQAIRLEENRERFWCGYSDGRYENKNSEVRIQSRIFSGVDGNFLLEPFLENQIVLLKKFRFMQDSSGIGPRKIEDSNERRWGLTLCHLRDFRPEWVVGSGSEANPLGELAAFSFKSER